MDNWTFEFPDGWRWHCQDCYKAALREVALGYYAVSNPLPIDERAWKHVHGHGRDQRTEWYCSKHGRLHVERSGV